MQIQTGEYDSYCAAIDAAIEASATQNCIPTLVASDGCYDELVSQILGYADREDDDGDTHWGVTDGRAWRIRLQ